MIDSLRHFLIGPPLPTRQLAGERLNKVRALAAFSPDAFSSIAYANQEIYLALVLAGSLGLSRALPISLMITALLAIVALSYYQTIHGYPSGGGSYVVARENLGMLPGLLAASALLVDYVLTAAVSLTAGVEAIASAFPALWGFRVELSLLLLAVITLINLRGTKETGTLMSGPVYLFLFVYLAMLAYGAFRVLTEGVTPLATTAPPAVVPLTAFLLLRAFATGCTAMTGIEAISNGVPAFRPPEAKNAGRTLLVMALLMGVLFVGSIGITQALGVVSGPQETILSALARRLLGSGPAYLIVQAATLLILAVAANTSFAGFPRLAAMLAADGFLPRQLTGLGDRLVFANGILMLSFAAAGLIVVFRGDSHALIPLFAIGVFLAYTLSQIGMVRHWARERGRRWELKAALNGLGAYRDRDHAAGGAGGEVPGRRMADPHRDPGVDRGLPAGAPALSDGGPAAFAARPAAVAPARAHPAHRRADLGDPSRHRRRHRLCAVGLARRDGGLCGIGARGRGTRPPRMAGLVARRPVGRDAIALPLDRRPAAGLPGRDRPAAQ